MKKTLLVRLRSNYTLLAFGGVVASALPGTADPTPTRPAPASPARHARINDYNPHLIPFTPEDRVYQEKQKRARAEYASGRTALTAGKFGEAEADLRESALAEPRGETYLALAETLAGQGRILEALQAYGTVFHPPANNSWGGSYMTQAHLEYGVLLAGMGQWAEAVAAYNLAMTSLSVGDAPQISVHFEPNDPQPASLEAAAHLALGLDAHYSFENDRAFQEYAQALHLAPDWPAANYYYGHGWQQLGPSGRAKFGTHAQATAALQKAAMLGKGRVKQAARKALLVAMKTE